MKKKLNNNYIIILVMALLISFSIGYFTKPAGLNEEPVAGDTTYQSVNYDKMRISYLNIKERKTGTPSWNSTSDMNGNDSSDSDNYLRTMDTMSYILEVGIERNEETTEETDNYYGGIIKLRVKLPKNENGKPYLVIVEDAWMNVIEESNDGSEIYAYYAIPSDKSPIGGNQQLSVTVMASDMKHEITEESMPTFEVWMEGNKPDNNDSVVESKKIQDEGPLYITGKVQATMYLNSGTINKRGTKNGVQGQYLNFGAIAYTYETKGYIPPKNTLSSYITIEYYYKDIEHGDRWINVSEEQDDPIYGTNLHSYGRACETTSGFFPSSSSNSGYGYCAKNTYYYSNVGYVYYYDFDSGTFTATQNGNRIDFSNTNFYSYGVYDLILASDGFELFVPWYEPEEDGRYQYQVKVTLHGLVTEDENGEDYIKEFTDSETFTFYNFMNGNFYNYFSASNYYAFSDTSLLPLGAEGYFYGELVGTDGPYEGGLKKLVAWNSSIVDFVYKSGYPYIHYYNNDGSSTTSGAVIYYGVYKDNKTNGLTTDELVNAAEFEDFDWYSSYNTAAGKGKVTALMTDEPGWRGYGCESDIRGIYLKAKDDESLLWEKGIIRQKMYIYMDSARTDVYEIGTDTDYISSIINEDRTGLSRGGTPSGIGETYYIGTNMKLGISNYARKSTYNVEEEEASLYVSPSYSNPTPGLETADFRLEVRVPKDLTYKENSATYEPTSVTVNSDGSSKIIWEFNDWDITKSLPRIDYKLIISPYAENNSSKYVSAYLYCSEIINDYAYDSDSFYVINLAGSSVRKMIDKSYLEIEEETTIRNYIYNIAQARLTNVKTVEILPKNGDSIGSSYSGSYALKVLSLANNQKIYYTTNSVDNIGLVEDSYGKKHIQPVDLDNDDRWVELQVGDTIPTDATAIATYIPEVSAASDIVYKFQFIPTGNKASDKYYFKITASSDNLSDAIATEYKKIEVYNRAIMGYVFLDGNRDNIWSSNYYDKVQANKNVNIYKSNGELYATVTTNENGMYMIENVPNDDYYIEYASLEDNQVYITRILDGDYYSSMINPETGKSDGIYPFKEVYYLPEYDYYYPIDEMDDDDLIYYQNLYKLLWISPYNDIGVKYKNSQLIVHHYIDGTTTQVHDDQVYDWYYTYEYTTSPFTTKELNEEYKGIYEFNGSTTGDPVSTTMEKDTYEVTYYYSRRPGALYVQHFIKGTNTKIVPDVVTPILFGLPYESSRIENDNYLPAGEGGDPPLGVITKEKTTVIYYYEPKPATITVHHYIEGTDTPVHEDDILNRNYNERYTSNYYDSSELDDDYKDIYQYSSSTGKTNGTVNEDNIEVIYYYAKKPAKLVVRHYILGTTFKVHVNEEFDKKINDRYETHNKESSELYDHDYVYDSVVGDEVGSMTTDRVVVTYYYKLKEGNIVVHHITDDTNEELCPDETASGTYKTKYNYDSCTTLSNINYTFKEVKSNDSNSKVDNDKISGRIEKDNTEITYYYTYKPGQIVVHHFLTGTRERVADDVIANGKLNQEYTSSAKELEGYKLVKEPEVNTITFKEDTQELVYEYERLKFKIEVKVVAGEGTITGAEEVFYGDNEKSNVVITPGEEYEVNSVKVNGKELNTLNIEGMTLNKFENIKENIKVEVSFTHKSQDIPITGKTRNTILYVGSILFILAFSIFIIFDLKKSNNKS